jgi:hypothetical protein
MVACLCRALTNDGVRLPLDWYWWVQSCRRDAGMPLDVHPLLRAGSLVSGSRPWATGHFSQLSASMFAIIDSKSPLVLLRSMGCLQWPCSQSLQCCLVSDAGDSCDRALLAIAPPDGCVGGDPRPFAGLPLRSPSLVPRQTVNFLGQMHLWKKPVHMCRHGSVGRWRHVPAQSRGPSDCAEFISWSPTWTRSWR